MRPDRLRAIAHAYRIAFDAWDSNDVALNRPYIGGHETTTAGPDAEGARTAGGRASQGRSAAACGSAPSRTSSSASSCSGPMQRLT